jgi:hypothetical protein
MSVLGGKLTPTTKTSCPSTFRVLGELTSFAQQPRQLSDVIAFRCSLPCNWHDLDQRPKVGSCGKYSC